MLELCHSNTCVANMATTRSDGFDKQGSLLRMTFKLTATLSTLYIANKLYRKYQTQSIKQQDRVITDLSPEQWSEFWKNGFVKIGRTLTDEELRSLKQRINDIMSGKIKYGDKLLMQVDQSKHQNDDYKASNLEVKGQSTGFKGKDVEYRKIGESGCGLEVDDLFLDFMRKPIFKNICSVIYGKHCGISMYRAMIFNKPSKDNGGGSKLPWHQDGGNWWCLDRDPLIFCWTALVDVDERKGCVQAVKGSHSLGLLSRRGHTLIASDVKKYCSDGKRIVNLEAKAGETYLCHNWLVHRSNSNSTNENRLGFSANYIDQRTRMLNPKPADASPLANVECMFKTIFPSPFG